MMINLQYILPVLAENINSKHFNKIWQLIKYFC